MNVCREFLSLTVPGLAEGRPSLLLGDKIVASLTGMMHLISIYFCCSYFYPNWNSGSKKLFLNKEKQYYYFIQCLCLVKSIDHYFPRGETALNFYIVWVNVFGLKKVIFELAFQSYFRFTLLCTIFSTKKRKS